MQMMRSKCAKCAWEFDVVAIPAPVIDTCRAMERATCPICANTKGNLLACERPLTEAEADHKRLMGAA